MTKWKETNCSKCNNTIHYLAEWDAPNECKVCKLEQADTRSVSEYLERFSGEDIPEQLLEDLFGAKGAKLLEKRGKFDFKKYQRLWCQLQSIEEKSESMREFCEKVCDEKELLILVNSINRLFSQTPVSLSSTWSKRGIENFQQKQMRLMKK